MITVPREVIEQVLETLHMQHIESFMSKRISAIEQLEVALKQPNTDLQKDAAELLFALQDAWPYVHQWCTIRSVKERIGDLLCKHGDFADLHESLPTAWMVWWGISEMRPLDRLFKTKAEAEAVARTIKSNTEVRPVSY